VTSHRIGSAGSGLAYHYQQGILVGVGSAVVVVAAFLASAIPATDGAARYGVLAATVAIFSAGALAWAASSAVAAIGFLVFDGFVVGRSADLAWHGPADLVRLLALAVAVCLGHALGAAYRWYRADRDWVRAFGDVRSGHNDAKPDR